MRSSASGSETKGERVAGSMSVAAYGRDESGRLMTTTFAGVADQSSSERGATVKNLQIGQATAVAANAPEQRRGLPTFGATAERKQHSGREVQAFTFNAKRVSSERIDGKLVEGFLVHGKGVTAGAPSGFMTRIDGKINSMVDIKYQGSSRKKIESIRLVLLDDELRTTVDMAVDTRSLQVSSLLALEDQEGLKRTYGKLLRGLGNIVLPDQLHAAVPPGHPCKGSEDSLIAMTTAYVAAAAALNAALASCTVVWFSCPAAPGLAVALAIITYFEAYYAIEYGECLAANPDCPYELGCEEGGSGGSGSSGGGSGGGGGGGWTSGGAPSIQCDYYEEFIPFPGGGGETIGNVECHA